MRYLARHAHIFRIGVSIHQDRQKTRVTSGRDWNLASPVIARRSGLAIDPSRSLEPWTASNFASAQRRRHLGQSERRGAPADVIPGLAIEAIMQPSRDAALARLLRELVELARLAREQRGKHARPGAGQA